MTNYLFSFNYYVVVFPFLIVVVVVLNGTTAKTKIKSKSHLRKVGTFVVHSCGIFGFPPV